MSAETVISAIAWAAMLLLVFRLDQRRNRRMIEIERTMRQLHHESIAEIRGDRHTLKLTELE